MGSRQELEMRRAALGVYDNGQDTNMIPPADQQVVAGAASAADRERRGSIGVAILRVALGVTIIATWADNLADDFYTADGLEGFFTWLFDAENGNASSLGFYESILDNTILRAPGAFGWFQTVFEGLVGFALLFGVFTRLASLGALVFFANLFLAYFGGEEWIWTYVMLMAAALTVFLNYGGRVFGVDRFIAAARGESPLGLLW